MADETYRLVISYNSSGQFAQNVLHYEFDDHLFGNTSLAALALINAWNTHCTGALKDALSTHTQILSFKARRITSHGGFEAVLLGLVGDVGNRTGDMSASGLAPYVRLVTNNIPPVQGRVFLPGVSDSDCVNGFLQSAFFTDLTALANVLDDSLTLTGGGAPTATPVIRTTSPVRDSIPVHIAVPSPIVSTQRRRQRPA
jgi:hypothetical protein